MVAHTDFVPQNELLLQIPPPTAHNFRQYSQSSISSTHSRNSLIKQQQRHSTFCSTNGNILPPRRRVHFTENSSSVVDESCGSSSESESWDNVQLHILEYDPQLDEENARDVFFTPHEILQIRQNVRKLASRFATDYPDFVETLDDLYEQQHHNCTAADLRPVQQTLRRRRKRLQSLRLSMEWDNLFNEFEDTDDNQQHQQEESKEPTVDDYFCDDNAEEDHLHYGITRGLEGRIATAPRYRRKEIIRGVLELQADMKEQGMSVSQIERCLCARAVQLTRKSRTFATAQAKLDEMDMLVS